jgi:hypothetical protein
LCELPSTGETMFPPRAPFFTLSRIRQIVGCARAKPGSARQSLLSFEFLAQCLGRDEVDKRLPPVDFDHGYQLAVARLEPWIAIDPDFYEFEAKFGA